MAATDGCSIVLAVTKIAPAVNWSPSLVTCSQVGCLRRVVTLSTGDGIGEWSQ